MTTATWDDTDRLADLARNVIRSLAGAYPRMNDNQRVAGLEARFYVRAAHDPTYRTPEALTVLVRAIMTHNTTLVPEVILLDPRSRARVAAAAMTGWAVHR